MGTFIPARTDLRDLAPGPKLFIYLLYFSLFSWTPSSITLDLPLQLARQLSLISNYLIQKHNKNNKNIYNGDCIFTKKNYFTTKEPKNHVLLEKLKLNF